MRCPFYPLFTDEEIISEKSIFQIYVTREWQIRVSIRDYRTPDIMSFLCATNRLLSKNILGVWGGSIFVEQNSHAFQWCYRVNTTLEYKREYILTTEKNLTLWPFKEHLILMAAPVLYFYINCRWTINFQISRSGVLFTFLIEKISEDHRPKLNWREFSRETSDQSNKMNPNALYIIKELIKCIKENVSVNLL